MTATGGGQLEMPERMSPISSDPARRIGVYKQFSEIPHEHRLESYSERYAGRDVWGEFLVEVFFPRHNSYQTQQEARRTGRKWRAVMDDNGRPPALARPADVEEFCALVLEEVNPLTAYKTYWSKLEQFYEWLCWHTDHPHSYNPVLLAASEHEAAREIWNAKVAELQNE